VDVCPLLTCAVQAMSAYAQQANTHIERKLREREDGWVLGQKLVHITVVLCRVSDALDAVPLCWRTLQRL
jgi:hypothetical protein